MQEIGIKDSFVDDILSGAKTIEGRLGKPKFLKIREGDILSIRRDIYQDGKIVKSYNDAARIYVQEVLCFESFEEMFSALDHESTIPSAKNTEDAIEAYRKFYSAEDESEFGVVAILFELV